MFSLYSAAGWIGNLFFILARMHAIDALKRKKKYKLQYVDDVLELFVSAALMFGFVY